MRALTLSVLLLTLSATAVRADEADPEPQTAASMLKKLKGNWTAVRNIRNGNEQPNPGFILRFEGDKASHLADLRKRVQVHTVKIDKTRRDAMQWTNDTTKATTRFHFKIEKDELLLVQDSGTDPKAKPDWTGQVNAVTVYQLQK